MIAITHTSVMGVLITGRGPWTVREIAETLVLPRQTHHKKRVEHYFYAVQRRLNQMIDDGAVERFHRSGPNGAHCYAMVKGSEG